MRIGLFTDAYYPIVSGVSISLRVLATELRKLGHEVYIITNCHENAEDEEFVVRQAGYTLPMKGMKEYKVSKVTCKKVRAIGTLNLDLVHCHTEFTMGRLGRRVAKKYHLPIVHTYHTMYEDYVHFITKTLVKPLRLVSKWYSKSFANSSDEVIFPTIKVKRTFDRYGFDKDSHIIPTGIYLDKFRRINYKKEDLLELRRSLGFNDDDFVMLFLGRMSREKSILDLVREFAKIDNQNVKLLLAGGGPDVELFEKLASELGILDRVKFTGMIPPTEVGKYYHISDLFVNFSITETQGLTYIEALACGLPLLVKYDDNLEGVIKQAINGYSFTDNSEFVTLFERIYNNPVIFNEITTNATKDIERFSAENYAKSVEKIYKKLRP